MPARPARRSADAAADVRNTVEGRGQKLIVAIEPEPVWVDGDSQRLPHVFDLFSQARPLEGIGLGIGLNVVREIVLLHGGSIEARRDGAWKGSEFIVRLPFAERSLTISLVSSSEPCRDGPGRAIDCSRVAQVPSRVVMLGI